MVKTKYNETWISVDIETTGLVIGDDNIASIGACVVGDITKQFYIELKPFTRNFRQTSVDVCGLTIDYLMENGVDIVYGMIKFEEFIKRFENPIFVGFPLPFDRSFIHWYFQKFLGRDPFGVTSNGIDIKTYAMCKLGIPYKETSKKHLRSVIGDWGGKHSHNALDDAVEQALLFEKLHKL